VGPWREQSTLTNLSIQHLNLFVPEFLWQLISPLGPQYNRTWRNAMKCVFISRQNSLCWWTSDAWIFSFVIVIKHVIYFLVGDLLASVVWMLTHLRTVFHLHRWVVYTISLGTSSALTSSLGYDSSYGIQG
jgi:hypothetical protein